MSNKSLKLNFIYSFILTFANMIFPLITAPYLSEILGAENIGKVNYATSIINWFIIFGTFGIPRYGMREIAKNRDNREETSNIFWNLIIIQAIFSVALIIIYIIMIFSVNQFNQELPLHLVMVLMLVLNIFSIDWFYQGIEEYGYITKRNLLVKTISVILIFLMINNREDYLVYALINIIGVSFNNILNYYNALKYIDRKVYNFKFIHYVRESKIFFYIALVVAIYTQLDQLVIGTIGSVDLAYYMRAKMILGVGLSLTTALTTVIAPRATYLVNTDLNSYQSIIQKSVDFLYLLGLPITVGIFMLSDNMMYFFGGSEFLEASFVLRLMTPLILIISLGSWVSGQILIPNGLEKISFKLQCIAVIISIVLNIIFIPKLSYIGAAITWIIVEAFLSLSKVFYGKKGCSNVSVAYITPSLIKFLVSSIIMAIVIQGIMNNITNLTLSMIVSVPIGALIYFSVALILKEEIIFSTFRVILKKIKTR